MTESYKVVLGEVMTGSDKVSQSITDSKYEVRTSVHNATGKVLYMCRVDGSVVVLQPSKDSVHHNALFVNYQTLPHDGCKIEYIPAFECTDLQTLVNSSDSKGRLNYDEKITAEEILKYRYGVYLNSLDVVITQDYQSAYSKHHPRCIQKTHNDYINAVNEIDTESCIVFSARLVDNTGMHSQKYMLINNSVQTLFPIAEHGMKDGLYITGLTELDRHGNKTVRKDVYYTWDQCTKDDCPYKLFDTFDLANESKPDVVLTKSIAELRQKFKQAETELVEREKLHKERILEMEIEQKRLDRLAKEREFELNDRKSSRDDSYHEMKHYRNMESERYNLDVTEAKYRYDKVSTENKTFSEGIKTIGLLAAGALAMKALLS